VDGEPTLKDVLLVPPIEPVEPPSQLQIVPTPPKRHRTSLLVAVTLAAVAVISVLAWQQHVHARSQNGVLEPVIAVRRTDFVRSIRLTGTIEAINFLAIAPPRLSGPGMGSLVITKLAASGSHVSKGDLLVQFDQQQQIKNALDQEATYVDLVEQIKKKKSDQATARAADESGLAQAENDMNSAATEVRRNEILSKIDAEKNNLAYEQAKATYAQLGKTFDLKRQAAQAEVKSLEIQRDRAKAAMEYARKNTARLEIHAPIDGIVVLNSVWKGGQMGEVQEGDEVRAGVPFMQIVNPGTMQVRARVNQADVSLLRVGQSVRVGLDAYPDLSFDGKVERIAAIGVTSGLSDKVRSFNVLFSISGSDSRLMPDLSASLDVELQRMAGVLTVPRASVISSGNDHFVMAETGSTYQRKAVEVSAEGNDLAVVSGVSEGTKVLSNVNR